MDTYRCSRGLVGRLLQPNGRNSANAAGGGCFCQRFAAGEQPEFHGRCLARNVRHGGRLEDCTVGNVTFTPGVRNGWHAHPGGQILLCTSGRGLYQEKGGAVRELRPGDVVKIAPGVVHWHGAAADSWFAHLAFDVPGEKTSNEWLEPVTDEEYDKLK